MQTCCVCGREVTPGVDCEVKFTGRRKYICYKCVQNGNKQISAQKAEYFDKTYEGQRRVESGRRKRKG